jgi:hypothetical protein
MLLRLGENVFGRDDSSVAFVSREAAFVVYSPSRYTAGMGEGWCTVTMIEESGRRHSVDVLASSTFDAAHIFLAHAKADPRNDIPRNGIPRNGIPRLSLDSVFEVVVDGKIHRVEGRALQQGILRERKERKGPRGVLFSRRPTLVDFRRQRLCPR